MNMNFLTSHKKQNAIRQAEKEGRVADSLNIRMAIMKRVETGEITLKEGQAELKRIKKKAKSIGMITRKQAWNGY